MRIYSLVLCGILVCSALFGQTRPSILQLKDLPVADVRSFGAVGDGVEDDTSAIQAAINDTTADTIVFPPGKYKVTSTLVINRTGVKLVGFGGDSTDATPGNTILVASGLDPAIQINRRKVGIESMCILAATTGIKIGAPGVLAHGTNLKDLSLRNCGTGVYLYSGNLQNWDNLFAETCVDGFVVFGDSTNTNGCNMRNIYAYGCSNWGLIITGEHQSSIWDVVVEQGENGIRVAAATGTPKYNQFYFYSEAAASTTWDISTAGANRYVLRDPDAALADIRTAVSSLSKSDFTWFRATEAYSRMNTLPTIETSTIASAGGALISAYTDIYWLSTTISSVTTPLYLENMAYVPVGKSFRIIKNDGASRAGFYVLPPFGGAMTMIGDASNVGGFRVATNPAVIEYTKIATDTIMGVSIR